MNIKKTISSIVIACGISTIASVANATVIPFGPQNDVLVSTVTNTWGWTECYSATYAAPLGSSADAALSNCSGTHLMLAARRTNSDIFEVLAAALWNETLVNTGAANNGTTNTANGSEWYYAPNYSWGFAGLGDSVSKSQCDTAGGNERDRLCWHTLNVGGWRAGSFTNLNSSTAWEKVILVANANNIPEPAAIGLFGLGLIGFGVAARRRK